MTTPSEKNPELVEFLEEASKNLFGVSRAEAITKDKCVTCGQTATEFRNEISRREYTISGMCQKCQDSVFGVD